MEDKSKTGIAPSPVDSTNNEQNQTMPPQPYKPQHKMKLAIIISACLAVISIAGLVLFFTFYKKPVNNNQTYKDMKANISFQTYDNWIPNEQQPIFGSTMLENKSLGKDTNSLILIGALDSSLFASSETTAQAAAQKLGYQIGEFFFPNSGQRKNMQTDTIQNFTLTGNSFYYEVAFDNSSKPDAQIYTAVVERDRGRWWLAYTGDYNDPVDKELAKYITLSISPL